jgi:WXG100 family type VII secretion target
MADTGPITVDYVAMEEAAQALRAGSKAIEEKLSELDSQLKQLQWDGQDREAYMVHKSNWDKAIVDMNQILHQIGGAVETARGGYGQAEQAGVTAWG